ncbi:MAG TPA: hypothetical protein VKB75_15220, partial [Jatrophihabitans sp.]|nr:hypothetical protein [Jatrophihabitans sp.]
LSPDPQITARATCIVAVGLQPAGSALAGPLYLTLQAGGASFELEAHANPSWDPSGNAVIRRSPVQLPGTFATAATAAAADLPAELTAALRDANGLVQLDAELIRGRPAVVLFAADPRIQHDPRLAAERAAADAVIAEDEGAARLLGTRAQRGPVEVDGRVLVVATSQLPGDSVSGALDALPVETVGLPPALAAAAASPTRAPVLIGRVGDPAEQLRSTPPDVRLVLGVDASRVGELLGLAAELRGTGKATAVQEYTWPIRVEAGRPLQLPSRDRVYLCFDASAEQLPVDPRVRTAVAGLLADGVPTKTAARALAELTGWPRRRAYDYLLDGSADE